MEQVVVIDLLDVRAQVEELKLFRHGWLDGKGLAPATAALDWITTAFEKRYPDDLRLPYLFRTPAGRVLVEWSLAPWSLSFEIDPVARRGYWHALNLNTDGETEKELNLASTEDWTRLAEQVRSTGGAAEGPARQCCCGSCIRTSYKTASPIRWRSGPTSSTRG